MLLGLGGKGRHALHAPAHILLSNGKKPLLGIIQQFKNICGVFVGVGDDFGGYGDELPLHEFLSNDTGVVFDIGVRLKAIGIGLDDQIGRGKEIREAQPKQGNTKHDNSQAAKVCI